MSNHMDIYISVHAHAKTGLLVATSTELKGLIVHGRTLEEVRERIPDAIRALFEAEGKIVVSVKPIGDDDDIVRKAGFTPAPARFHAELCEAA